VKYSDDIFRLVKTMSKQEKSYFKKLASAFTEEESNNYLKLFDEVVAQASKGDEYDEETIKKQNYSGKFMKNLSYHKNYLYNTILTAMALYHKDNKDMITLRNLITQSEILFDKLLFDQSAKVLKRAKKMAIEKESFVYLCDILARERIIDKYILSATEFSIESKASFQKQYEALDKIRNYFDYCSLHDTYGLLLRVRGTGFARSKEEFSELDKFFENDLLKNEQNAKTFHSKTTLYNIKINQCMLRNDFQNAYIYLKKIIKLWEEDLNKANGRFDNYIHALNNMLTCLIRIEKYDGWDETETKMKFIVKKFPAQITEKNRLFIFYSMAVLKMSKHMETLNLDGLAAHEKEVEKEISKFESKITIQQRIILYFFLGMSGFIRGEFEKCIFWYNKIIHGEKTDMSQIINAIRELCICFAIMNSDIMIHWNTL